LIRDLIKLDLWNFFFDQQNGSQNPGYVVVL